MQTLHLKAKVLAASIFRIDASEFQGGKLFMHHFLLLHLLQSCVCRPCKIVSAYHGICTFRPT